MTQSGQPAPRGSGQPERRDSGQQEQRGSAPQQQRNDDLPSPVSAQEPGHTLIQRLRPPMSWWVISAVFVVSAWVAVGFYLGTLAGVLAAVSVTVLVTLFLTGSTLRVQVDGDGFAAAGNRIEWRWVSEVIVHDRESTRRRLGPGADPRAHLITRPWATESVELVLDDPADPHPYWLVSAADAEALRVAARRWLTVH